MTNEMLADAIKNGGNNELIPILWERVKKLLFLKCEKYYKALENRFSAVGVEKSDIQQECYFVFLEALRAYRQPCKFVTFLEFPFKKMMSKLLKNNLSEQEIYTESLDTYNDDNSYSLSEILADESCDILYDVDRKADGEIVRGEVEKLSYRQNQIIKLYYFYDKKDYEIAELLGKKPESVCQLRHRALANLRRSAALQKLCFQPDILCGKTDF